MHILVSIGTVGLFPKQAKYHFVTFFDCFLLFSLSYAQVEPLD